MNFKIWLKGIADYCESTNRTLIPVLTLVYQIHNEEYDEDASILQLKSTTNIDHEQSQSIFKAIRRLRGQNITFRKWIIQQMPYPSTAHFEYLAFGRRLSRKAKWTTVGRAKLSSVLTIVSRQVFKPSQQALHAIYRKISEEANEAAAKAAIGAIYGHTIRQLGDGQLEFKFDINEPNNWFNDTESSPKTQAEQPQGSSNKPRTNRSNANTAKHNIKRFSSWILRTESSRVKAEIREHWDNSRAQFKAEVIQTIGEAAMELFLLETDQS